MPAYDFEIFLYYKPGSDLGMENERFTLDPETEEKEKEKKEGGSVPVERLRKAGDDLKEWLHKVADNLEAIIRAGWNTEGLLYSINLYPPLGTRFKGETEAEEYLRRIGADSKVISIQDHNEELDDDEALSEDLWPTGMYDEEGENENEPDE